MSFAKAVIKSQWWCLTERDDETEADSFTLVDLPNRGCWNKLI